MAEIRTIYSNDDYYPFILYCENHGYVEMADLTKCEFNKVQCESDVSPSLLSKIKMIYILYCKKHPTEFIAAKKAASVKPVKSVQVDEETERQLKLYFESNSDKLIHISDITKSIGKKVKRSEIVRILSQTSWCKAVDETTFFYSNS
jgi:hypothetical protein